MLILLLMSLTLILMLGDIIIKFYIEGNVARGEKRSIWNDRVEIRKEYNEGFAFNLLEDHGKWVRIASAYTAVILTIYQLLTLLRKGNFLKKIGLSLAVAGAWSNLFDRWVRTYVIDYIGLKTKWKKINDLTFNLGDFFILTGGAFIIITNFFHNLKHKK